jgi:hypothetical protein
MNPSKTHIWCVWLAGSVVGYADSPKRIGLQSLIVAAGVQA